MWVPEGAALPTVPAPEWMKQGTIHPTAGMCGRAGHRSSTRSTSSPCPCPPKWQTLCVSLHPLRPAGLGRHAGCQTLMVISVLLAILFFNLLFSFPSALTPHPPWFKVFKRKYASCDLRVASQGLRGKPGGRREEKKEQSAPSASNCFYPFQMKEKDHVICSA